VRKRLYFLGVAVPYDSIQGLHNWEYK